MFSEGVDSRLEILHTGAVGQILLDRKLLYVTAGHLLDEIKKIVLLKDFNDTAAMNVLARLAGDDRLVDA